MGERIAWVKWEGDWGGVERRKKIGDVFARLLLELPPLMMMTMIMIIISLAMALLNQSSAALNDKCFVSE